MATTILAAPSPMPGSFWPDRDPISGRDPFCLPPPDDPSGAAAVLPQSTSRWPRLEDDRWDRKRPRLDTRESVLSRSRRREPGSPPPLVDTAYKIAGGLDADVAWQHQLEDDAREHDYEGDCRPNRFTSQSPPARQSYLPHTPTDGPALRNKRRRSPSSDSGWGRTFMTLGGLAGKVIHFCWNTTFSGFRAGGGEAYNFEHTHPGAGGSVASSGWTDVRPEEDVFHSGYQPSGRPVHTPVPGGFPEDVVSADDPTGSAGSASSSLATDAFSSSLHPGNWVMVDGAADGVRAGGPASPTRKTPRASTTSVHARSTPRSTHSVSRPRLASRVSTHRSSASYASPRLATGLAAPPSYLAPTTDQPRHGATGHARRPSSHRVSVASPRRAPSHEGSPVTQPSPEVRKFEQKMRRKEARQDETMQRFNEHLQAMIWQGQQALNAKFEVEELHGDVDEGYEEGRDLQEDGMESWERDSVRPSAWS